VPEFESGAPGDSNEPRFGGALSEIQSGTRPASCHRLGAKTRQINALIRLPCATRNQVPPNYASGRHWRKLQLDVYTTRDLA
jgi:hypothetical protein